MKKKKRNAGYVLDSFALLAYYNDESGSDKVEELLKKAQEKNILLYISEITIGEAYYVILRTRGIKIGEEYLANLLKLPIVLIPANLEQILAAARYKSKGGISYADCFVLAIAKEKKSTIITGDPEFLPLENQFPVLWIG
ncbi:MAG: type II toxin-antitoxin system VapC family toxin [Patescibacteria group bacterium]